MELRKLRRRLPVVALALAMVAAACGGDNSSDSSSTTAAGGSTATTAGSATTAGGAATTGGSTATTAGGTATPPADADLNADVIFSYAVAPVTLDPHRSTATGGGDLYLFPIYDRLLWLDDDFQLQPMLATDWEFAAEGSTLTLTLRDDATFADGSKIDSTAVKANLDRARSLEGGSLVSRLKSIASIAAPDPTTVVITLNKGTGAELPALLIGNAGMMMNPKAFADPATDLTTNVGAGNTSGPFTVESITPGVGGNVTYARRADIADYWDKQAGGIAKLQWLHIPTAAQRINAVRAGDITMGQVTGVDVAQAKQLVDSGQATGGYYRQPLVTQVLWMRATRAPLDNLKLRQAIQLALDKKAITDGLLSGLCTETNQDYPADTHWASSAAVEAKPGYDLEKAKQLVAESGVANPTFTMIAAPTWQAQGQAVQQLLKEAGITVNLEAAPTTPQPSFARGDFDAQQGAFAVSPDPTLMLNELYFGNINLVPEGERAQYTDLLAQLADPTNDQDARAGIFDQIAQKLYDGAYSVPVCYGSQVWLDDGTVLNQEDLWGTRLGLIDVRHIYIK